MRTRTTLLAALVSMVLLGGCEAIVLRFGEGSGTTGGGGETTTAGTGGMGGMGGTVPLCDPGGGELCPALSVDWSYRRGEANTRQSGTGLAVTSNGEMIVGGTYDGQIDFGPCDQGTGLLQEGAKGGVFFAKLHPNGQCIWARTFDADVDAVSVAADAEGGFVAAGFARGSYDFQDGLLGVEDVHHYSLFLLKLSAEGDYVWSASITAEGSNLDAGESGIGRWVTVAPEGPDTRVFVVGERTKADKSLWWKSTVKGPTKLPLPDPIGEKDAFVLALEPTQGNVLWSNAFGAPSTSITVNSVVVRDGELDMAGSFKSTTEAMPVTVGDCVLPYQYHEDVFAAGLSVDGPLRPEKLSWCAAFGGEGVDKADAIARNDQGEIFLSGALDGTVTTNACFVPAGTTTFEAFVAKLDAQTHALAFVHRFDGGKTMVDVHTSLSAAANGCVAFSGLVVYDYQTPPEGQLRLRQISRLGGVRVLSDLALNAPLTDRPFRHDIGTDEAGNVIVFGTFAGTLSLAPPGQPPLVSDGTGPQHTDLFLAKLVPSP
jgi:hypothetical protein